MKTTLQAAVLAVVGMVLAAPAWGHSDEDLAVQLSVDPFDSYVPKAWPLEMHMEMGWEGKRPECPESSWPFEMRHWSCDYTTFGRVIIRDLATPFEVTRGLFSRRTYDPSGGRFKLGAWSDGHFDLELIALPGQYRTPAGIDETGMGHAVGDDRKAIGFFYAKQPDTEFVIALVDWMFGDYSLLYGHVHYRTKPGPDPDPPEPGARCDHLAVVPAMPRALAGDEGSPDHWLHVANPGAAGITFTITDRDMASTKGGTYRRELPAYRAVKVDMRDVEAAFDVSKPAGWWTLTVTGSGPLYLTATMRQGDARRFVPVERPTACGTGPVTRTGAGG